jgi:hypothetical protein
MANKEPSPNHKGGENLNIPSRRSLYNKIALKSEDIFEVLFDCLKSNNEAIKLGAAKTLINKILPDLKTSEITGDIERPIGVIVLPKEKINYDTPDSTEEPAGEVETTPETS